jgi:hypothetical protein
MIVGSSLHGQHALRTFRFPTLVTLPNTRTTQVGRSLYLAWRKLNLFKWFKAVHLLM